MDGYLCDIKSDSQTVWTCMCTIVPPSLLPIFNLQVLICSEWLTRLDFKNPCPFFGWPSSHIPTVYDNTSVILGDFARCSYSTVGNTAALFGSKAITN